jgi:hypothetical protein
LAAENRESALSYFPIWLAAARGHVVGLERKRLLRRRNPKVAATWSLQLEERVAVFERKRTDFEMSWFGSMQPLREELLLQPSFTVAQAGAAALDKDQQTAAIPQRPVTPPPRTLVYS